jgi:hypothetical protein
MKQPVELPISGMVVGDSFFVPCIDTKEISNEAHKLARQHAFKLRIEKVVYEQLFGVRIWRIE